MKTVEFERGGYRLVITEAAIIHGLRRELLQDTHARENEDEAGRLVREIFYPDLTSVVKEQSGFSHWPLTLEEFEQEVPDDLLGQWLTVVYELNPTWTPKKKEEADDTKKKASTSDSLDTSSEA